MQDIADFLTSQHLPLYSDYERAFNAGFWFPFDTETDLIKEGTNTYVDVPEFVLGSCIIAKHGKSWVETKVDKLALESLVRAARAVRYIIIGHNITFDLNVLDVTVNSEFMLWDTALYEYIRSGQSSTFPSLEATAERWLPPGSDFSKLNTVSEAIKAGVSPKDIPIVDLTKYCEQDVYLTKAVFEAQFNDLMTQSPQFKEMVINQMHWLRNVYQMSKNGLKLDLARILHSHGEMVKEELKLHRDCCKYMSDIISIFSPDIILDTDINPMSNKQLETLLFGGTIKGYKSVQDGLYKTGAKAGTPKFKKIPENIIIPIFKYGDKVKPGSVDSNNLNEIIKWHQTTPGMGAPNREDFLNNILELRDIAKTRSTYFEGYSKYADSDGYIHSEMKHVGTPTGRLSSTKPNIQNLKGDE